MKKGIYNIVFGTFGQLIILALGICVPRFILKSYGDEANGLINAIGQLFTYLALIEAGVGQAALQSLYGPVARGEHESTNSIMSATQQMFRKLTLVYGAVVLFVAACYPFFVEVKDKTTISFFGSTYWAIFFIIFIQGMSNAITFYFVATLRQILIADGYNYIIVNITTLIKVATSVLRIVLINAEINIVLLQMVYVVINIIEVIIYYRVFRKKYSWLNMKVAPNKGALAQKNSFVVHEFCNVIFSSTDVLILSLFCSLEIASIYAIYNLVFSAVNMLISQIHNGCFYILGQTYNQNQEKYIKVHDAYDTYYISFVFAMISTTYLLILPFVRLYTEGVTNINYVDSYLPFLFCLIQLLSCCRITSSNLIKIAGHAKRTISRAMLEMVINLVVSIALVNVIGIYGVLLGTICALLYRTNDMIIYANKKILVRSSLQTYRTITVNMLLFRLIVLIEKLIKFSCIDTFISFFVCGVFICVVMLIAFAVINSIVDRDSFSFVIRKMIKKNNIKGRG